MCRDLFFFVTNREANHKPTVLWDTEFSCNTYKYFKKHLHPLSHQVKLFQNHFYNMKDVSCKPPMEGKVTSRYNNHISLQLRVKSETFFKVLLTILEVFLKGQFIQNCLNKSVSRVFSLSLSFCVLFSELFTLNFSKFCLHPKQPVVLNKGKKYDLFEFAVLSSSCLD